MKYSSESDKIIMDINEKTFTAGVSGRDIVTLALKTQKTGRMDVSLTAIGCLPFLRAVEKLRQTLKGSPATWALPEGSDHVGQLLREVILKGRGEWNPPYQEEELCHCRSIPTQVVNDAIVCGAENTDVIAKITSAGTACGTCRPNSQALINYRKG